MLRFHGRDPFHDATFDEGLRVFRPATRSRYPSPLVLKPGRDLGLEVKELTRGGVDVAIEASGRYPRLHDAIRATRQGGRVVTAGFYAGEAAGLSLGREFFHDAIELRASLPAPRWGNADR